MPTALSKDENENGAAATAAAAMKTGKKGHDDQANAILRSFFMGVCNFVLLLPAELQVISQLLRGDIARTSKMLALSSGISGAVEFMLNPTFGKLSDRVGRRPFFLIGPTYVCLGNALLASAPSNSVPLAAFLLNSILRKCSATVSGSVASVTALNDISSGREFAVHISKLWAYAGAGVVVAPFISGYLESSFGPRAVYGAAALGGLAQLIHNHLYIRESLPESERTKESPSSLSSTLQSAFVNPFACFKILTSGGSALRVAALACVFASFMEGKNMSTTNSLYLRQQCGLNPLQASRYTVLYGVAMYVSGKYWVPILLRRLGPDRYTTVANLMNAAAMAVQARARTPRSLLFALALLFTGINANSSTALKAIAGGAAAKRGYGRGEFNGHFSNLRALVTTWAPVIYGGVYARALRRGLDPGPHVYGCALLMGCLVPELLHRSLPSRETAAAWGKS